MITLDGAYGEGGGALVRVALALSTLTNQPFEVKNIRAGRAEPGLKAQHFTAIEALKKISAAKSSDVQVGSTEFWFEPGIIKAGRYDIDIGTAGSISLLLQALLLPCMFARGKVALKITGGTCGKWQASVDYFQNVLLPVLQPLVKKINLKILRRGYYPKGAGEIILEVSPKYSLTQLHQIKPLIIDRRGTVEQVRGIINVSADLADKQVAERICKAAENKLRSLNVPITIRIEYANSQSTGGELLLYAVCRNQNMLMHLGGSSLVEKSKSSEQIGQAAAAMLLQELSLEVAVDHYLADQLIPIMAIVPDSKIKAIVSDHTLTNIYVVEKFLPIEFVREGLFITSKFNLS